MSSATLPAKSLIGSFTPETFAAHLARVSHLPAWWLDRKRAAYERFASLPMPRRTNEGWRFSNLSTLPPIYTVLSVDASRCSTPCVVSATLKNLGGKVGARAPSTITFTMTDSASKKTIGSCQAEVQPDVGYNATTKVSCTISLGSAQQANAALITATPENPGRA